MQRRLLTIVALGALTGCDLIAGIDDNEYTRSEPGGGGGSLEAGACGIYWTSVLAGTDPDEPAGIVFESTGDLVVGGHYGITLGDGDG
ncbi:MAG: hypothetical protein JRI68_26350, partial [Deltaproteobacteria bacterium]|nr:hypothetical protein [Deltaproteobacteria bacterium]